MNDLQDARNRVANLEEESFGVGGINPALLLGDLILSVEVLAESKDILHLVLTDEELAARNLPAYELPEKPVLAQGANQLQLSTYTARIKEWSPAHTAFKEVKQKLYATFGAIVKDVVNEVVGGRKFGISRRDIRQMLQILSTEYSTISINESAVERKKLDQIWNQETPFTEFSVNFNAVVNFLAEKGQPISTSEQILCLQKAVAHVPSFTIATAMFFQTNPQPAAQTLNALCTVYKNHYKTMVMTATAQSTGFSNQVTTASGPNEAIIKGVTEEVRMKLGTTALSDDQARKLQVAISKAIASVLQPDQGKSKTCPKHPGAPHAWKDCRANPVNAKK